MIKPKSIRRFGAEIQTSGSVVQTIPKSIRRFGAEIQTSGSVVQTILNASHANQRH
ncbi:hypothetical protein [Pandoraea captiosa]|uniref:hypothetical protein n=1 Tax=Pandoraea captiosa TaxID=2508302 RepID=UPI0015830876|nr:hypothetical protein [Pandoraea captiosa]